MWWKCCVIEQTMCLELQFAMTYRTCITYSGMMKYLLTGFSDSGCYIHWVKRFSSHHEAILDLSRSTRMSVDFGHCLCRCDVSNPTSMQVKFLIWQLVNDSRHHQRVWEKILPLHDECERRGRPDHPVWIPEVVQITSKISMNCIVDWLFTARDLSNRE